LMDENGNSDGNITADFKGISWQSAVCIGSVGVGCIWTYGILNTKIRKCDVCLSVHLCICVEKKNQLDTTEWFIALIMCLTCFGHFYAHHQELKTICVLIPPMVCDALVAGCWRSGAGQPAMRSGWGMLLEQHPSSRTHSRLPAPDLQQPATKASHNIGGNNTHIVSSSWWWA
jgi:hypothetical protein